MDLLAALSRNPPPRGAVSLVTPQADFHYSGLLPGIIAGDVRPAAASIPVARIATAAGVIVHHTAVSGLDAGARVVRLEHGDVVPFDVLSLDVGSAPSALSVAGASQHAYPMRPFAAAMQLRARLQSLIDGTSAGGEIPAVVVGAGAAGVEIAFAIAARIRRSDRVPRVTLVDPAMRDALPLPGFGASSRRLAARALAARGIVISGARVTDVRPDGVGIDDAAGHRMLPSCATAWVTGPAAPGWFAGSGLSCDAHGYALADARLALDAAATIFGGGDCVTLRDHPDTPKAGVFAVRMAPVLAANVLAAARGASPPLRYEPQRSFLALLSTGDGAALLRWRGVALESRAAQWLKTWIDRSYLQRYARLAHGPPPRRGDG